MLTASDQKAYFRRGLAWSRWRTSAVLGLRDQLTLRGGHEGLSHREKRQDNQDVGDFYRDHAGSEIIKQRIKLLALWSHDYYFSKISPLEYWLHIVS